MVMTEKEKINAIDIVKQMVTDGQVSQEVAEKYFPELKEREDERIRKVLVDFFKSYKEQGTCGAETFNGISTSNILSWLEKQGEQKSIWHNEDEEPQRDSLILLIMQSGTPIVAKVVEPNHTFNHGERWAYIDDLFERQGENTLIEEIKRRKELLISEKEKETSLNTKLSLGGRIAMLEELLVFANEKQGEQKPTDKVEPTDYNSIDPHFSKPIDKVEPMFNIGDTIVEKDLDECGYGTIKDIKDGQYIFTDGSGMNINEQNGWQLVKTSTNIK